jgi:thioester reductase-like protein
VAIFLTGSTGYIGAYIAAGLLDGHREPLNLLIRAKDQSEAEARLWQSLQLHYDFPKFSGYLHSRINIFRGDLTNKFFGLPPADYQKLVETTDSIIHCAASLNRKSEKSCLNTNLRGTLEVIQIGQRAQAHHGLRRISHVSTVAVAGKRQDEVVQEDTSVDWQRSDYDPYARTKKFCEHMIRELLPDVPRTIFRPSIVLGDSRAPETTQFDMVRAFVFLAGLPVLPLRPSDRVDIVNVDFVADAIVTLHQKPNPQHEIYHLSSGTMSQTFRELTDALSAARKKSKPVYVPGLSGVFTSAVERMASGKGKMGHGAALMKVFLPYLQWNTVFDNSRVVTELGRKPVPFSQYSLPLLRFSLDNHFQYQYRPWPAATGGSAA